MQFYVCFSRSSHSGLDNVIVFSVMRFGWAYVRDINMDDDFQCESAWCLVLTFYILVFSVMRFGWAYDRGISMDDDFQCESAWCHVLTF